MNFFPTGLNRPIWFLLAGSLVSRAAFFLSMPYLAISLKDRLGLDPVTIGLMIGLGPFAGIAVGLYIGHLSDQIGRRTLLAWTLGLWSLVFAGFAWSEVTWHYFLLSALNGICSGSFTPLSSALISDLTPAEKRGEVFQFRYYLHNVAASFGPLAGVGIALTQPSWGFLITAAVHVGLSLGLLYLLPASLEPRRLEANLDDPASSFRETLVLMSRDRLLLLYTLGFIVMSMTYAQLETTLPQYLSQVMGQEGVKLFGVLCSINGLTVVVAQLPLQRWTRQFTINQLMIWGSVIYGLGFAGLALPGGVGILALAMMVLTIGEIMMFSNANLLIDEIAPDNKKGAYFGASSLWALGPTLGPAIGGWLLMRIGGPWTFISLGIVAILNLSLYKLGTHKQPSS